MSTKKVKNSSQSGTVNKAFGTGTKVELDDKTKTAVAVVADNLKKIDEALEVVAASNADSFNDEIEVGTDVDFSFGRTKVYGGRTKRERTARQRAYEYGDEPVVYVAGTKRELVKLEHPPKGSVDGHQYRQTSNPVELSGTPGQHYTPDSLILKDNIDWYHVALPEIDVYITQGSELTIDERISTHYGWEGEEGDWIEPVDGKRPEMFIIGSSVKCRSLAVGSRFTVNNSRLETTGHLDGISSRVVGCRINILNSIDIYNSGIYTSCIEGANRLMVRGSRYIRHLNLSGFDHINLSKITTNGNFRVNAAWQSVAGLGLDIADVHLVDFSAQFREFSEVFGKEYGSSKPWQGNGLYIRRRTDYGYFAGAESVPFIRCGDYNIATPSNLYLAKEIDPISFPKEKAPLTYQPQFGGGFRNEYPGPALEDNTYTMGMRGGKLWEKARKDCFANNANRPDKKRPVGSIGDNLIQSLVEQIKSRVKLYVEMAVLTEV